MLRKHSVFLAALILALSSVTLADFTCNAKYFLKSANTDKYYTVDSNFGYLDAVGTVRGWWQQFTVCRDSSWAPQFFVLKSEALSSQNGKDYYVVKDETGLFNVRSGTLTGNHLFKWGRSGSYWGLIHAETRGYASADGGPVYLGPANLGWDQALWREA